MLEHFGIDGIDPSLDSVGAHDECVRVCVEKLVRLDEREREGLHTESERLVWALASRFD